MVRVAYFHLFDGHVLGYRLLHTYRASTPSSTTRHFGQESEAVLPGEEPEQEGTPGEQLPLRNPTKGPLTKGLALPTQKARIKPQEGR